MIGTLPFLQMRKLEFEESKGDDKCLQLMGGEVAGSRSLSMAELNTDSLDSWALALNFNTVRLSNKLKQEGNQVHH